MSNLVLNGGVNNVKYIWHVESDKACEACQSLDGTEYNYEDDIPDRPHPNCRCYIEIVENKPLARILYHNVDIGMEIPPELYQVVAEILARVLQPGKQKTMLL